ncbi:hypothetical protein [Aeromicrobium sp. UC242_57]|uniref:hypothetical protein n=1 Tax=Aeromicrobium sp. UC242_57 TaxID=3374624 RepID=UPI00379CABD6
MRRTAQAKQARGKEVRQFRMHARATSSLPQKVSRPVKVTVLLDPKVYYRVLKASVQHTANAQMARSGCSDVIASFSATKRTSASLGPAEKGRPKWKAKRLANGAITADVGPRVSTRWIQNLAGCRYDPRRRRAPRQSPRSPAGTAVSPCGSPSRCRAAVRRARCCSRRRL